MVNRIKLANIPALCRANCRIAHPDRVETLINNMAVAGTDQLQLISDFDFTISKQRLADGTAMQSSFFIFERCPSIPQAVRDRSRALCDKYRPIEVDGRISIADKLRTMVEWWTESSRSYSGFPLDPAEIEASARIDAGCLRDGTAELFETLGVRRVPVLVFSAGIGDMVAAILRQAQLLRPTVHVVSNFLRWKEGGVVNGFDTERMIHVFNKNETALAGTAYYDEVHDRTSVIVMGDSLGDAAMATGSSEAANVLRIGFLADEADETNLRLYAEAFDIVLVDDQTMDVPRAIVEQIVRVQ